MCFLHSHKNVINLKNPNHFFMSILSIDFLSSINFGYIVKYFKINHKNEVSVLYLNYHES